MEQVVLERFVAGLPGICPAPPRGGKPEPAPRRKFLPCAAAAATDWGPSSNPPSVAQALFQIISDRLGHLVYVTDTMRSVRIVGNTIY